MTRPRRRTAAFRAVVAASCAALALTGCANDDDDAAEDAATPTVTSSSTPSDAEQISALAVEILTTDDLTRKCEQLATSGFVLAVFGSQEECKTSEEDGDDGDDPTGAEVKDVVITGDSASAVVTLQGGDTDGASGAWRFTKDPGGGWRLAEWSIDYLRSVIATGFGPNYPADPGDPLADAEVRSCFTAKLQSLDDQNFRSVVYTLIAGRDDADDVLGEALVACGYDGSDSDLAPADSEVRAAFEASYRTTGSRARPGADIDCELEQLRETITDDQIAAAESDEESYNDVASAAAAAQSECAASGT